MRNTGPKTRLARRAGEALREKDVKYLQRRNYPPGMHGQGRRRISEYGTQLAEKQKVKWTYGIAERQFRRYVDRAAGKPGMTGSTLLAELELRLDNVVYRLGFAQSRPQGRQLVGHGFITVGGKRVTIPSYQVKVGDTVAFAESKKAGKYALQLAPRLKDYKPLSWVDLDAKAMSGRVLTAPTADNIGSTFRMELVIEHYSR